VVKRTFLHIGGEKTGTTTLQRFLSKNARQLRRLGCYYPCENNNPIFQNKAHFPLAACLIPDAVEFISDRRRLPASSVLSALTDSCSARSDSMILSCEHFSSRLAQAQQLETLRDALRTDEIKIVFYAREPSDLALAAWSTGVRSGSSAHFNVQEVVPENRYFNHLATLDLWASIFGRENMIVREYDRNCLIGNDIRSDFCRLLGVNLSNPRLDEDENKTFDVQRLEVLRFINSALPSFEQSPSDWRRAQQIRNTVAQSIPLGGSIENLLSGREAALIKTRFRSAHDTLNERYFDGQLSKKWFADSKSDEECEQISPAPLDTEGLLLALRQTIIHLAEAAEEQNPRKRLSQSAKTIRKKISALISALSERRGRTTLH
jgi:hypothetical protein